MLYLQQWGKLLLFKKRLDFERRKTNRLIELLNNK